MLPFDVPGDVAVIECFKLVDRPSQLTCYARHSLLVQAFIDVEQGVQIL